MTEYGFMKLAHEISSDIARTEERSTGIDTRRRTCVAMTEKAYREVEAAADALRMKMIGGFGCKCETICGYPVRIIKTEDDAPVVWVMREIEGRFFNEPEEGADEGRTAAAAKP